MKKKLVTFTAVLLLVSMSSMLYAYDDDTQVMLETIGAFCAQGLYLTYSAIGTTIDAWSFDTYTDEDAVAMISEYVGMCEAVKEQLEILLDSGVMNTEDDTYVSEVNETFDLLVAQGNAAIDYINTYEESYLDRFEVKRNAAWDMIAYLLGLE